MRIQLKKMLSILLALIFCFALVSATALADEPEEEDGEAREGNNSMELMAVAAPKTLLEETSKRLSELGEPPIHTEGYRGGGWVLLDFGCVVVHIFLEDVRKFYDLERLWADAERMDVSEILK